jgi:hypothetical protein
MTNLNGGMRVSTSRAADAHIVIRFSTDGDRLDEKIAASQYEFWATHCEAIFPDGVGALRFDDAENEWRLDTKPDMNWIKQTAVTLIVAHDTAYRFYKFLINQFGAGYDYRSLAGVRQLFADPHRLIWGCADLIYAALIEAGIVKSAPPGLAFMTPRDLLLVLGAIATIGGIEKRHIEHHDESSDSASDCHGAGRKSETLRT